MESIYFIILVTKNFNMKTLMIFAVLFGLALTVNAQKVINDYPGSFEISDSPATDTLQYPIVIMKDDRVRINPWNAVNIPYPQGGGVVIRIGETEEFILQSKDFAQFSNNDTLRLYLQAINEPLFTGYTLHFVEDISSNDSIIYYTDRVIEDTSFYDQFLKDISGNDSIYRCVKY